MNILDAVIIIVLLFGVLSGIKNGVIKSLVSLIGVIIALIGAFYLKNPVSAFFYKNLPFIELKGAFEGVSVINIIIYEILAFIIIFVLFIIILKIILKVTNLVEKLLKVTVILGFISSTLGAVVGFIEAYIITFVFLFIFNQPFIEIKGIEDSKIADIIINSSPILTNAVKDTQDAMDELNDLYQTYHNDKSQYNQKAIEVFLKYNIIDEESVKILKEKGKLNYND